MFSLEYFDERDLVKIDKEIMQKYEEINKRVKKNDMNGLDNNLPGSRNWATLKKLDQLNEWSEQDPLQNANLHSTLSFKPHDQNTRYQTTSVRDSLPMDQRPSMMRGTSKKAPTTVDMRSKSHATKQSLFTRSKLSVTATPFRNNPNAKQTQKKADDIFSRCGPDDRKVKGFTAENNRLANQLMLDQGK